MATNSQDQTLTVDEINEFFKNLKNCPLKGDMTRIMNEVKHRNAMNKLGPDYKS